MSIFESNNTEVIAFHYVCKNTNLLTQVSPAVFKNPDISLLFKIVKEFFNKYGTVPQMSNISQIREVAAEEKKVLQLNPAKQPDENIKDFLGTAENIITHPMDSYSREYIESTSEGFLRWRKFANGMQTTINFVNDAKPTAFNTDALISEAQSIFLNQTSMPLAHEERAIDFWSPSSHIQVQVGDLVPCGWPTLNKFLNGGFEKKTLTHFWSAPNTGKTLFLATIGRDVSILGKNVYVASLEMAANKYSKRMGSGLFGEPIATYGDKTHNEAYWAERIAKAREPDEFGNVPGALYIQRFTHATPLIITNAANNLAKELGLSWDMVIYDYLGEMESSKGFGMDAMYAMHKTNNAELFDHAVRYNWAALTAHQVKPDEYDKDGMTLKSAAESSGIGHRTDNIFGIIQDPIMFSANKFFLKSIKARDNEYKNYHMRMNIDWKTLTLTDDRFEVRPGDEIHV